MGPSVLAGFRFYLSKHIYIESITLLIRGNYLLYYIHNVFLYQMQVIVWWVKVALIGD